MNRFTRMLVTCSLAVGCAATPWLRAQEEAPKTTAATDIPVATQKSRTLPVFTFYLENDFFRGTDRYYTNGVKFSWLSADLTSWGQTGWRKSFLEALPFVNRPEGQKNLGFALGQNIYTPTDTRVAVPDPNDRPYAGWSYVELSFLSKTESVADVLAIQLGMVGRHSYAQDIQRIVHKLNGNARPNGWEHQLGDEVGLNVVFERKWRMYARTLEQTLGIDFVLHVGASVGNVQTYANVGGTVRLGVNLPNDFGTQIIRAAGVVNSPLNDADPRVSEARFWSFFIFGGVDARVVARDIFLDGNTFKDSPSVKKEIFVGDLSYGIGIVTGRWQFTYAQVTRTREFKNQPLDANDFGSIAFSRTF